MIITAKWLVPVTSKPIENAALFIEDGKIAGYGPQETILKKYPNEKMADFGEAIILPGFVNAHTHIELSLFKDKFPKRNFLNWLQNIVPSIKDVSEEEWRASCQDGINEIIKSGTTTVGDIVTSGYSICALQKSGLRAKAYIEAISRRNANFEEFTASFDKFQQKTKGSLIELGISPHSLYSVKRDWLKALNDFSARNNLDICMHVAESKEEVEYIKEGKGELINLFKDKFGLELEIKEAADSSVDYLKREGFLNSRFTAVHATQATENDLKILKESGSHFVLCPRSNEYLGVGLSPLNLLKKLSIDFALGTDSLASNSSLNIVKEASFIYEKFLKNTSTLQSVEVPEDLLKALTINGAKALGLEKKVGSIEVGKEADIIIISSGEACLAQNDLYEHIIKGSFRLLTSFVSGQKVL